MNSKKRPSAKATRAARHTPAGTQHRRSTRIVALTLAHEMAAVVGAVGEDFQDLVFAALTTGEWLAMAGRPGCWDSLEVDQLMRTLPSDDRFERGKFLISLTGLIGYAGIEGHLAPADACRSLKQIEAIADDGIIANYARKAAAQVRAGD
jgi:hypothetical protein